MRNFFSVFLFYIRQICFIFKGRLYNSIESLKLSVKYLQGYLHVSFLSPRSFLYVVVFQLVAKQSFCCGFPFGRKRPVGSWASNPTSVTTLACWPSAMNCISSF